MRLKFLKPKLMAKLPVVLLLAFLIIACGDDGAAEEFPCTEDCLWNEYTN